MAISPGPRLTDQQEQRSRQAQADKRFTAVTPAQLFGPKCDPILAASVFKQHPVLYRHLRTEYTYEIGDVRRPDTDGPDKPAFGADNIGFDFGDV